MAARPLTGEKLEKELARLEAMKEYEYTYQARAHICGIDEAGSCCRCPSKGLPDPVSQ